MMPPKVTGVTATGSISLAALKEIRDKKGRARKNAGRFMSKICTNALRVIIEGSRRRHDHHFEDKFEDHLTYPDEPSSGLCRGYSISLLINPRWTWASRSAHT